jgi:hypothetical protein
MAKHRAARPLRRIVPALIALALAGAVAVAFPATASSPSNVGQLNLVKQNSVEKFNCHFDVSSVDNANGTVTGTMQGNAFPVSLLGYFTIAHNTVNCVLADSTGTVPLDSLSGTANKPSVHVDGNTVTVPYDPAGYTLCGSATAVLNNGSSSTVSGCIHS